MATHLSADAEPGVTESVDGQRVESWISLKKQRFSVVIG